MLYKATLVIAVLIIALGGCDKRSPKRDQIPLLKTQLLKLQTAVREHNRAAIDSLLSVKIVSKEQGSDSLLAFVYGSDGGYSFEQFGRYSIMYTTDKARIECYIMDSTAQSDRPIVFFLAREHDMWLYTSFEEGSVEPADSTQ